MTVNVNAVYCKYHHNHKDYKITVNQTRHSKNKTCTEQKVIGKRPVHRYRDRKQQIKPTSVFEYLQEMFGLHSQLRVILALRNCLPWSTELYKSTERGQPKPLAGTHKALPCSQACYTLHRCSKRAEK